MKYQCLQNDRHADQKANERASEMGVPVKRMVRIEMDSSKMQ